MTTILKVQPRKVSSRGVDKRSRPITLRLDFMIELKLTALGASDGKDVAAYLTDLLTQMVLSKPELLQQRRERLISIAAANGKTLEEYLRDLLEARFPLAPFNWDVQSAETMVFGSKPPG